MGEGRRRHNSGPPSREDAAWASLQPTVEMLRESTFLPEGRGSHDQGKTIGGDLMNIGKEKPAKIIEPVVPPVPQKEPAPREGEPARRKEEAVPEPSRPDREKVPA